MIKVFHVPIVLFRFVPFGIRKIELASWAREHRSQYIHVANVDTMNLEEAWERTNSIDDHWSKNKGVETIQQESRSSSVGDIFEVDGVGTFVAASIGFERMD